MTAFDPLRTFISQGIEAVRWERITMLRFSSGLLFVVAVTFSPCGAHAASIKFDCDTAAGAFSEISVPQSGPAYRIAGSVSARKYRVDGQWAPAATVGLMSADGKSSGAIRLQAPTGRGAVELVVQSRKNGKDYGTVVGTLKKEEVATFSLEAVDGKMTIRTAGKTFDGPDVGIGASVNVTCSSGEFLFENLDWEPPQPK
jgi:hypothetical protein